MQVNQTKLPGPPHGGRVGGEGVPELSQPRGVLFDLDGTLIDSVPDLTLCMNQALTERGLMPHSRERMRHWVGNGSARLAHRAITGRHDGTAPAADFEAVYPRFLALYLAHPARETETYPGAAALLDQLRGAGMRIACVTNKPAAQTRAVLSALGLAARFDAVVGGDDTPALKPDPAPVLRALELLQLAPGECMMVGDSRPDLEAARAAGVRPVIVRYGYDEAMAQALAAAPDIATIDHLALLPGLWTGATAASADDTES